MITSGLHHASFPVRDLARARHFYGDVLGLEEIDRPNFPFAGAWYRAGAAQVHLIVPPPSLDLGTPTPSLNPMAGHTAFTIDDYDAVLARLKAEDLEILETSTAMGQMWVRDPDGNVIELITRPAEPR
jgi:glyoxylase I family protein